MIMAQGDYLPGTYSRVGTEETKVHIMEVVQAVTPHRQCHRK